MAKGVEDTAFYRYVRLVALNEVGSDPDVTSTLDDFHAMCVLNLRRTPMTLLATTTHDTKRSEDARVRIALLSEMPQRWREAVATLHTLGTRHRGDHGPSRQAEYLFYQTLVGAHPLDADRAWAYMLKAAREAKIETSWLEPNTRYETDLEHFVRGMVDDAEVCAEIGALIECMTPEWQAVSLSQTLIKLTAPGVPDIYQGSELWDCRLVDPDNRTPGGLRDAPPPASRRHVPGSRRLHVAARGGRTKAPSDRYGACCACPPPRGFRQGRRIPASAGGWLTLRARDLLLTDAC